jgi:hypothetical protein
VIILPFHIPRYITHSVDKTSCALHRLVGVSVAYNFQTGNTKIKLLTEYEGVTQEVLFGNAVLAALMSGRKYDVISQNGDVVTELSMENIHLQIMLSDVG